MSSPHAVLVEPPKLRHRNIIISLWKIWDTHKYTWTLNATCNGSKKKSETTLRWMKMETQHTKTSGLLQLKPPVYRIHTSMHFISILPFTRLTFLSIEPTLIEGCLWARHYAEVWRFRWPNPIQPPRKMGTDWLPAYTPGFRLARSGEECCYFGLLLFDFVFYFTLAQLSFPLEDVFSVFSLLFWYLYSPFQIIFFVDFVQLMLEPQLLDSGYLIFPIRPPPPAQGTRLSCNISLRKVELDSH